ncbi:ATP-binding cassette domain-containing protein [Haloechinothrix sp. LS1_15]|uniref:ABC transporter ATP-binding protein n=1 Tax=Haloechinothrix sp. LS1_15 TaxID=2652248 RepID=UPI0029468958|nr:ATP-binding cassette domain-containing protein [Haloechinothrix sp. LS1_15]MDV6011188.1 ATP-binding cassette domain-containing protein [Haloechinothrix sp. LS1_15]
MLSVRELTKSYNGARAVDQVSFDLQPGTVTAFLGPNGAGKSTTLRMITGLTPPSAGGAWIAGRPFVRWPNPSHVAGVLLDASAVHPGRTGRSHLRNAARLAKVPLDRADATLAEVGLADAATRRIGKYSLGMRQRLGLAQALLTRPPVLILDEPINGLDPEGIRAMRSLLRNHAAQGGTVLLSSHVLAEVDQTADRLLVIGRGRILADGALRDLVTSQQSVVSGPDMPALANALQRAGVAIRQGSNGAILAGATTDRVSEIAFQAGVRIHSITEHQLNLEDLFFRLTGGPQQ